MPPNIQLDFDLRRAKRIFQAVAASAPPQTTRELLEAVLGLRASRIQVSRRGLDAIDNLCSEHSFGASVADYKVVCSQKAARGGWSDAVSEVVPLQDSRGEYLVYIGRTQDDAERARIADASGDDDAFGASLGIPACCRRSFANQQVDSDRGDPLAAVLAASDPLTSIAVGANVLAKYFGRGYLSHYPCSLHCRDSAVASWQRHEIISKVDSDFGDWLAEGARRWYLVLRSGIAAYEPLLEGWPDGRSVIAHVGCVPEWAARADTIRVSENGGVQALLSGGVSATTSRLDAFLVRTGKGWT